MEDENLKDEVIEDLGIHPDVGQVLANYNKEKANKSKVKYLVPDIRRFIISKGLKPGKVSVPDWMVYDLYLQWTDDPCHLSSFTDIFTCFFHRYNASDVLKYYKLDPEIFGLSEDFSAYTYAKKNGSLEKEP